MNYPTMTKLTKVEDVVKTIDEEIKGRLGFYRKFGYETVVLKVPLLTSIKGLRVIGSNPDDGMVYLCVGNVAKFFSFEFASVDQVYQACVLSCALRQDYLWRRVPMQKILARSKTPFIRFKLSCKPRPIVVKSLGEYMDWVSKGYEASMSGAWEEAEKHDDGDDGDVPLKRKGADEPVEQLEVPKMWDD